MENLTSEETLRLAALQLAVDSLDKVPLVITNRYSADFGDMIAERAKKLYEFLVPKVEEADETS